jgi:hypothetical protein
MLDEHCNRTLVSTELLDTLGVNGPEVHYTLSSCSGSYIMSGRRATNYVISEILGDIRYRLPTLVECSYMPQEVKEIPTPEVARNFHYLQEIADKIPEYDPEVPIGLLIGRNLLEAHHIQKQLLGPKDAPFAQKVGLGWVIIGDVCLNKRHHPELEANKVSSLKTNITRDGRTSIFTPCTSYLKVTDNSHHPGDIFEQSKDDNEVGWSTDDRQFLSLMSENMFRDSGGNWTAPLPFRESKPQMPNNFPSALKRAKILDSSLRKNSTKREHFV